VGGTKYLAVRLLALLLAGRDRGRAARFIIAPTYVLRAVRKSTRYSTNTHRFFLESALSLSSADPWNYNNIGIEYRRLRDFDAALLPCSRAVELDADYGEALYNIAHGSLT